MCFLSFLEMIIIVNRFLQMTNIPNSVFLMDTVYLTLEVKCKFFAESLLRTWWWRFQANIFILRPKQHSVGSTAVRQVASYLLT